MKVYLVGGDTDKTEFIHLRREIWLMHTDTGNAYSIVVGVQLLLCILDNWTQIIEACQGIEPWCQAGWVYPGWRLCSLITDELSVD